MTLLEAVHAHLKSRADKIPSSSFFMLEDDDKLNESVLITPYGTENETTLPLGRVSFQIKNRAKTFPRSEEISWDCFNSLFGDALSGSDRRILGCIEKQEPSYIGKDDKGRHVHVFNVEVIAAMKGV